MLWKEVQLVMREKRIIDFIFLQKSELSRCSVYLEFLCVNPSGVVYNTVVVYSMNHFYFVLLLKTRNISHIPQVSITLCLSPPLWSYCFSFIMSHAFSILLSLECTKKYEFIMKYQNFEYLKYKFIKVSIHYYLKNF